MPDDLDDKIRAAMKVLDEETPSGYFEAVPNLILARLEDGSMQHGSGTTDIRNKSDALMGPPVVEDADTNPTPRVEGSAASQLPKKPAAAASTSSPGMAAAKPAAAEPAPAASASMSSAKERDEDSGLHDIRNLAQSTKQRLSARRITQNPPNRDDDVLASSSGSFANIALPQPAKMVALPEIEDLPSKQEVIAAQKAAAKARKNKQTTEPTLESKDVLAPKATANAALASLTAMPVAEASSSMTAAATDVPAAPARQAFTLPSMQRKSSKAPLLAVLGIGAAAAAGAFIFLGNKSEKSAAPAAVAQAEQNTAAPDMAKAAGSAAPVEAAPTPPPAPAPEVTAAAVEEKPAEPAMAAAPATTTDADDKADPKRKRGAIAKGAGAAKKDTAETEKVEEKAPPEPKVDAKTIKTPDGEKAAKKEGEGEPSFDALLKEAGVSEKKEAKPKLEKKSLSGDDFKKGMSAINAKAQGCYKGTQGTASVKLTVAPSGAVTKVTVGGQFAGTPEGACVEAAVKGASFPAWDGGPQSFNYSYMLSD